jgi:hypothetical protein
VPRFAGRRGAASLSRERGLPRRERRLLDRVVELRSQQHAGRERNGPVNAAAVREAPVKTCVAAPVPAMIARMRRVVTKAGRLSVFA